jgi:hypothetical protein
VAVENNRVGQEAEEEVTEDEEAISEEFDREGDQGAESEYKKVFLVIKKREN